MVMAMASDRMKKNRETNPSEDRIFDFVIKDTPVLITI